MAIIGETMRTKKAQSIGEYVICLAVITLAISAMQFYIRRGLQGRYADVVDHVTAQVSSYSQYEPYYVNFTEDGGDATKGVTHNESTNIDIRGAGELRRDFTKDVRFTGRRLMIQEINPYDD